MTDWEDHEDQGIHRSLFGLDQSPVTQVIKHTTTRIEVRRLPFRRPCSGAWAPIDCYSNPTATSPGVKQIVISITFLFQLALPLSGG